MDSTSIRSIVDAITPERCAQIAVALVDIPSPTGSEQAIAEYVADFYREIGAASTLQEFEPGRYNAIGQLRGAGGGVRLLFNGHLDVSFAGTEPYLPSAPGYRPQAVVSDGWIHGMGVHNMKSGCAAFLAAAEAIARSGIRLRGDLMLALVGGEIERHSVLNYQGPSYRGGGCGTRHFVANGGVADFAVVGEPTQMALIPEHVGSAGVRISTRGLPAPLRVADNGVDAIRKMRVLIDAFDDYAHDYMARNAYKGRPATVHMHSIEGGWPFRCNRVPIFCHVFLEYRVMPNQRMNDLPEEVDRLLARVRAARPDIEFETEFFVSLPPARDESGSVIASRLRSAHRLVHGNDPAEGLGLFCSDAAHLQAYGIPAVNYGPSGRTASGKENWDPLIGEHTAISDLTATAKVYAALALDVCSRERQTLVTGAQSRGTPG